MSGCWATGRLDGLVPIVAAVQGVHVGRQRSQVLAHTNVAEKRVALGTEVTNPVAPRLVVDPDKLARVGVGVGVWLRLARGRDRGGVVQDYNVVRRR